MGGTQSLEALKAAWRRDPQAVFVRLGHALRSAGDLEQAVGVLRGGIERWPHNLAGHVALAATLADAGDGEGAESALAVVLARDGGHWAALDLLARLRCSAGDRRSELDALLQLGRQSPGDRGVQRRTEAARRQLSERAAPAARDPRDRELSGRAPAPQPLPSPPMSARPAMQVASPLSAAGPRVTTAPSAVRPVAQRSQVTNPQGASPRLLRRSEVLRTSPGSRPAQPGIPRSSRPPPAPDPFANETMVELLVDQGRLDEARTLLVELVRRQPGRRSLAHRLVELGGDQPNPASAPNVASPADLEALMRGVLSSAAAELDALLPAPSDPEELP